MIKIFGEKTRNGRNYHLQYFPLLYSQVWMKHEKKETDWLLLLFQGVSRRSASRLDLFTETPRHLQVLVYQRKTTQGSCGRLTLALFKAHPYLIVPLKHHLVRLKHHLVPLKHHIRSSQCQAEGMSQVKAWPELKTKPKQNIRNIN